MMLPFIGSSVARTVGGGLLRRFGGGLLRRRGSLLAGATGAGIGSSFGGMFGGGDDDTPRRRRRKALTDTDVRTALTIASAISKKAAENFILMRVRGG